MHFDRLHLQLTPLHGAIPAWQAQCGAPQLKEVCATASMEGARLASLWGTDDRDRGQGFTLHVALAHAEGLLWLKVSLASGAPDYPDLSEVFPAAQRLQRAAYDLVGLRSDARDQRPWLRHGAWPASAFPLQRNVRLDDSWPADADRYAFVRVEGDGVHEIPVGPVHAGTIEPGHFRFSIVGEELLRLEERLGYKHKGVSKRFESLDLSEGARLAGRISGDSTVAYAWAYAMAMEAMAEVTPSRRALELRAIFLERERIANHLGDLGALGNDAGFAFGLSQFMRLKEDVLRLNARLLGHRYLMDVIVPGGVAADLGREALQALASQCDELEREVGGLRQIYEEHAGLQDRFLSCGVLKPEIAARLGVSGLAGRASGQAWDVRAKPGFGPYNTLELRVARRTRGDVAARVLVRFDELAHSLELVRTLTGQMVAGPAQVRLKTPSPGAVSLGWVEGWRGDVLVALEAGESGRIRRCHTHDPSWQNWPALEHAAIGNIVPDFPLINKSFNLSYSGHDL